MSYPPSAAAQLAERQQQLPSLFQQYAQAQQIENQKTQQQTAQLQQTGLQQENQIRASQIRDTETLRSLGPKHVQKDADGNVTGFDTNGLLQEAAGKGVNPQILNKMRLDYAEAVQKSAAAGTAQIELHDKQNDQAYQILEGVRAIKDPTTREAAYQKAIPQIKNLGVAADGLPATSDDTALQGFEAHLGVHKQVLADAKTQSETAANAAKVTAANTGAQRLQAELPGGPMQPVEQKELSDWLAKNPNKGPADFLKYKASLAPAAAGAGVPTKVDDPLVQAVANGKMKIADVLTARVPIEARKQFLGAVMQANPNFDSRDYDIEKGVMKSATSGDIAKNLTSFNTAIEHAKQLQEAAKALDPSDVRTFNKISNTLGVELGSDKVTNFNVIKNALAGEISKVFKGGQATDSEIKAVEEPFHAANSPAQLKGAIDSAIKLMGSKRDALKQQVEKGMHAQPNFGNDTSDTSGGGKKVLSPAEWLKQQKP